MSNPFYQYTGGGFPGAGGDGAPPPRQYTDYEVDLIASRYADVPLPNLSPAEVGYFDAHLGATRSAEVLYHHSVMGSHSTFGQSEPLYSSNTTAKRPRLESSLNIYLQQPKKKACAFFMRSRLCKYGEDCKFDHPQWVPEGGIPNWREVENVEAEDSYPERPGEPDCPYFTKTSECFLKSKCKFNHPKKKGSLIADRAALPVRPSEPVCSYYEKTGNCKFGARCRFNHPKDNEATLLGRQTIYTATIGEDFYNGVADASIPGKENTPAAPAEAHNAKGLPIRPAEIDCSFYMKTGSCKFGSICWYNHPDRPGNKVCHRMAWLTAVDAALPAQIVQGILPTPAPTAPAAVLNPVVTFLPGFGIHATTVVPVEPEPIIYPQRPGETVCDFYMKTGHCKYTDKCRFHHPIDRSVPPNESWVPPQTVTLTLAGFPRRQGAEVCAFYMRSGTCKFGAQCRFDHPPPEEAITKLAGERKGAKKAAKLKKAAAAAAAAVAAKQDGKKAGEGLSIVLAKP